MKALNEFLNEGFESEGKSLKDLLKLPDSISSISVPTDLKAFASQSIKIDPTDKNWRKEVEKTLKETLKDKKAKTIDTFLLKSYFGRGGKATDSYYIELQSQGSRDFADSMGKGKFGLVDSMFNKAKMDSVMDNNKDYWITRLKEIGVGYAKMLKWDAYDILFVFDEFAKKSLPGFDVKGIME